MTATDDPRLDAIETFLAGVDCLKPLFSAGAVAEELLRFLDEAAPAPQQGVVTEEECRRFWTVYSTEGIGLPVRRALTDFLSRRHISPPAPQRVTVTDEMVERAVLAYCATDEMRSGDICFRESMRAALEAALAVQPEEASAGSPSPMSKAEEIENASAREAFTRQMAAAAPPPSHTLPSGARADWSGAVKAAPALSTTLRAAAASSPQGSTAETAWTALAGWMEGEDERRSGVAEAAKALRARMTQGGWGPALADLAAALGGE